MFNFTKDDVISRSEDEEDKLEADIRNYEQQLKDLKKNSDRRMMT